MNSTEGIRDPLSMAYILNSPAEDSSLSHNAGNQRIGGEQANEQYSKIFRQTVPGEIDRNNERGSPHGERRIDALNTGRARTQESREPSSLELTGNQVPSSSLPQNPDRELAIGAEKRAYPPNGYKVKKWTSMTSKFTLKKSNPAHGDEMAHKRPGAPPKQINKFIVSLPSGNGDRQKNPPAQEAAQKLQSSSGKNPHNQLYEEQQQAPASAISGRPNPSPERAPLIDPSLPPIGSIKGRMQMNYVSRSASVQPNTQEAQSLHSNRQEPNSQHAPLSLTQQAAPPLPFANAGSNPVGEEAMRSTATKTTVEGFRCLAGSCQKESMRFKDILKHYQIEFAKGEESHKQFFLEHSEAINFVAGKHLNFSKERSALYNRSKCIIQRTGLRKKVTKPPLAEAASEKRKEGNVMDADSGSDQRSAAPLQAPPSHPEIAAMDPPPPSDSVPQTKKGKNSGESKKGNGYRCLADRCEKAFHKFYSLCDHYQMLAGKGDEAHQIFLKQNERAININSRKEMVHSPERAELMRLSKCNVKNIKVGRQNVVILDRDVDNGSDQHPVAPLQAPIPLPEIAAPEPPPPLGSVPQAEKAESLRKSKKGNGYRCLADRCGKVFREFHKLCYHYQLLAGQGDKAHRIFLEQNERAINIQVRTNMEGSPERSELKRISKCNVKTTKVGKQTVLTLDIESGGEGAMQASADGDDLLLDLGHSAVLLQTPAQDLSTPSSFNYSEDYYSRHPDAFTQDTLNEGIIPVEFIETYSGSQHPFLNGGEYDFTMGVDFEVIPPVVEELQVDDPMARYLTEEALAGFKRASESDRADAKRQRVDNN